MTKKNRFNQAEHQSAITNSLSKSKDRQIFLEDNDNIDMKYTYKIRNVHPPIDEKDIVNKGYCDKNLLSSSKKIDILSKNLTELIKGKFDKITTKTLQLKKFKLIMNELIISLLNLQKKLQILLTFAIKLLV